MNTEFMSAIDEICREKGIDKETLMEAIETALVSAYKRNFGTSQNVEVTIDRERGDLEVYSLKTVKDVVEDDQQEISLEKAKEIDPSLNSGDILRTKVTPEDFGRIAAQNAKQVVVQRIREAERELIYNKYVERENELVTGIVQRIEKGKVYVSLDKAEAILMPREQMFRDHYRVNDRLVFYITEVKETTKGPQIYVSRTHPGLVKRLFEREVPEIVQGDVLIKSIAREAGSRTKISVYSDDSNIDPVGACVGRKGIRVHQIVEELNGEKIDIITWDPDPVEYIASALSPARILSVQIDELEQSARVVVPDDQLSLAIGKEGQNARLAAKLTGWKIDIKSQSQMDELENFSFLGDTVPQEAEDEDLL
jgi:N utilization substance protein A